MAHDAAESGMSDDERPSSNDPRKLKEQGARVKDREKQDAEDLKAVLSTQEGRRFVRGLLADCGEHRTSFHTNAIQMSFNEGQRNVGLKLKSRIVQAELLAADAPR
jgi:hypothetical protein